jgi:Tfp pilus assembly protein PilN
MIQFNLLPYVKQEYVKARRLRRLVTLASFAVSGAAVFLLVLMVLSVEVVQKKSLHDLNGDISRYSKQLKAVPDLDKILTVQNQLNTLTGLHDQKAVVSRLFGYIAQLTPPQVSISTLTISFVDGTNTINVQGEAPSLDVVNAYADTLKATTYKTDESNSSSTKAFSKVVLTSFGRNSKGANYTIDLEYDPAIFSSTNQVTLKVPAGNGGAQAILFQKQVEN